MSLLRSTRAVRHLNTVKNFGKWTGAKTNTFNEQKFKKTVIPASVYLLGGLALYYMMKKKDDKEEDLFALPVVHAEEKHTDKPPVPVYKIVLTGGPCGGKSSAMAKLRERLQSLGFQVFIVTEIATLLMTGGATFRPGMSFDELITFESALMQTQMNLEDSFSAIAQAAGKPTVLLCDRGVMDAKAYLDDYTWEAVLDANTWTVPKLRDARYDCVVHLVTAAIGAEKYYTLANNLARTETVEQASKLDIRLREAYLGHSDVYIIDNSTAFDQKIQRVLDVVSHKIGFPRPINYRRRFLLKGDLETITGVMPINVPFQEINIEQVFLKDTNPRETKRIVKRGQSGVFNYTLSTATISEDGKEEIVGSRPITAKTYVALMEQRDTERVPINKRIRTFVHKEHYLELHSYTNPKHGGGVHVLQVEIDPKLNVDVSDVVPPFLRSRVAKEVTNDINYSSFGFSRK